MKSHESSELRSAVARLRATERVGRTLQLAFDAGHKARLSGAPYTACLLRRPDRRNAWLRGWQVAVVLVPLAALGGVLAKVSGEDLASMRGTPQPYADLAVLVPIIVLVLILWLLNRGRPTNRARPLPAVLLAILTVAAAGVIWRW